MKSKGKVKILSFLGTNGYIPCNYIFEGKYKKSNEKYFQVAVGKYYIEDKKEDVELIVFCTKEAVSRNLYDREDEFKKGEIYTGLKSYLDKSILKDNYRIVENGVKTGTSNEEIWSNFQLILNQINEGDRIVFDVTHGFRSLPLLAMVVINYAKYVLNVKIEGVYYGAFEKLGSAKEVSEMPIEKRDADALDLNAFNLFIDWIVGVEKYLSSGDATNLKKLVNETRSVAIENEVSEDEIKSLKEWMDKLQAHSKSVGISESRRISSLASEIKSEIGDVKSISEKMMPALDKTMGKIEDKFINTRENDIVYNVHETVKWCYEHNMMQQASVLFKENLVTYIFKGIEEEISMDQNLSRYNPDKLRQEIPHLASTLTFKPRNSYNNRDNIDKLKNNREFVLGKIKERFENGRKNNIPADEKFRMLEMVLSANIDITVCRLFNDTNDFRNYISHGGFVEKDISHENVENLNAKFKGAIDKFTKVLENKR